MYTCVSRRNLRRLARRFRPDRVRRRTLGNGQRRNADPGERLAPLGLLGAVLLVTALALLARATPQVS